MNNDKRLYVSSGFCFFFVKRRKDVEKLIQKEINATLFTFGKDLHILKPFPNFIKVTCKKKSCLPSFFQVVPEPITRSAVASPPFSAPPPSIFRRAGFHH